MKTTAKPKLEVGQRVQLETYGGWVGVKERTIDEYEIVAVNKTNAYAVDVDSLEKYRSDEKKFDYFKKRINLRTHEIPIDTLGYSRRLWLTKEDFERNVQYNSDLQTARQKAHATVDKMSLVQLQSIFGEE